MRRLIAASLTALSLSLAGCAAPAPEPSPTVSEPTASRTDVDWSQYSSETQRIIDEEQAEGDCESLQGMFDVAADAGFLDQMNYIDEALRLAGCYE